MSADAQVNGTETAPVSPSQFEQFVNSVEAAAQSVTDYSYDSEAWAKGTRGGVAVPSTDETYHNNSKYYADQGAELSQEVTNLKSEINDNTSDISALQASVTNLGTHKIAQPLDGNNQPTNGTSGQSLRTKGNGQTEWADVGLPTDAQTAQAVSDWLDDHPEATTTVQDHSITVEKINDSLKKMQVYSFDTVDDMKIATYLKQGMTCHTKGFRTVGDGGGAYYIMSNDANANGMDVIACANDLCAELVINGATINVRQMGAYGDNTHDDYTVFARAIEKLYEIEPIRQGFRDLPLGGGVIYIPKGHYHIGTTFSSSEIIANISFIGESMGNTFISASGAEGFCHLVSSDTYHSWNIKFKNLAFYDYSGISMACPYGCEFENLRFVNAPTTWGMRLYLTAGTVVKNCIFSGMGTGLEVSGYAGIGPATTLDVHDCWFNHCGTGVSISFVTNGIMTSTIHDCIMEYCGYGIYVTGSETYPTSVEIRNIHFEVNDVALKVDSASVKFENLIQADQMDKDYFQFYPQSYNTIIGRHLTAELSDRLYIARHQNNITFIGEDGTLFDLIGHKVITKARTFSFTPVIVPTKVFFEAHYVSSNGSCICTGKFERGVSSSIDSNRLGTLEAGITNDGFFQVYEYPNIMNPRLEINWGAAISQ